MTSAVLLWEGYQLHWWEEAGGLSTRCKDIMAVYKVVKEVDSVKSALVEVKPCVPLNPAKMSVMRDRQD